MQKPDDRFPLLQGTTGGSAFEAAVSLRKIFQNERPRWKFGVPLLCCLPSTSKQSPLDCGTYAYGKRRAARPSKSTEEVSDMSFSLPSLDIFKKDVRGNPIWIDAVEDLDVARFRLSQLASVLPGEYFVFDQRTRRIVVSVPSLSSDGT